MLILNAPLDNVHKRFNMFTKDQSISGVISRWFYRQRHSPTKNASARGGEKREKVSAQGPICCPLSTSESRTRIDSTARNRWSRWVGRRWHAHCCRRSSTVVRCVLTAPTPRARIWIRKNKGARTLWWVRPLPPFAIRAGPFKTKGTSREWQHEGKRISLLHWRLLGVKMGVNNHGQFLQMLSISG